MARFWTIFWTHSIQARCSSLVEVVSNLVQRVSWLSHIACILIVEWPNFLLSEKLLIEKTSMVPLFFLKPFRTHRFSCIFVSESVGQRECPKRCPNWQNDLDEIFQSWLNQNYGKTSWWRAHSQSLMNASKVLSSSRINLERYFLTFLPRGHF